MNFTEQYRARTLAFIMPPSEGPFSGWKGYALRVTVLAVGFGIYALLFKKKDSSSGRWSLRRTQKTPNDNSNTKIKELRYDLPSRYEEIGIKKLIMPIICHTIIFKKDTRNAFPIVLN